MTDAIGLEIGDLREALADRYDIRERVGTGAMSLVYLARDLRYDRQVAVKVLRREFAGLLGVDRFLQEIRFVGSLQHPNILPILDDGTVEGVPYFTMPYVEAGSLKDRLAREGPLPVETCVRIAHDVLEGLSYAHGHNVVHRDVKPANILIAGERALLSDFGIARAIVTAGGERLTSSGVSVGTPQYMSPEQTQAVTELDGRADLYSLGCVVYEMLAGRPPFDGPALTIAARHLLEDPAPLSVVRPAAPEGLVAAVERMLAKAPADRFESARAAQRAIEAPRGSLRTGGRSSWRRWAGAAAAVAVLGTAAAAAYVLRGDPEPPDPNRVLVLPLLEEGADAGAGYDVALAIGMALEHSEPLRFIDGRDLLTGSRASPDTRQAADLARRTGAAHYLGGIVRTTGDSTTVILRMRGPAEDVFLQESETGAASVPPYQLGLVALRRLLPRLLDPDASVDLTPITERDHDAIALSILGQGHYIQAQFREAFDMFSRAVAEDSTFAFAAIKGAQAASWLSRYADAELLSGVASRNLDELPPKYRAFATGLSHYFAGRADSAARAYEAALEIDPGWEEAQMALGEVFYHLLPARPSLDSLAEARFRAALGPDSAFSPPLYHLAEIAIRRGALDEASAAYRRFIASEPDSALAAQLGLMVSCVQAGATNWVAPAGLDVNVVLDAASALSAGIRQPGCAEKAYRAVLREGSPYGWLALTGLQSLLVAQAREHEAMAVLDSAISAGQTYPRFLYLIDAIAGSDVDERAEETHASVVSARGESLLGASSLTLWALGSWYASRGMDDWLETARRALDSMSTGSPAERRMSSSLAAQQAWLAGDPDRTIELLTRLRADVPAADLMWGFSEGMAVERQLLARALLAVGRPADAERAAATFDHPGSVLFTAFVPASLRIRYQAAVALGQAEVADRIRRRLERIGRADLLADHP